jgi:hypothetical protein
MSKAKTEVDYENYRIEVQPELAGISHDSQVAALVGIKKAIERHVDNAGPVTIHWDTVERCAYCKMETSIGYSPTGEPCCCDEAQQEWMQMGNTLT